MRAGRRGGGVVVGALLLLLAGAALGGSTLVQGWFSPALVVVGAVLLGAGVSIMTIPAPPASARPQRGVRTP